MLLRGKKETSVKEVETKGGFGFVLIGSIFFLRHGSFIVTNLYCKFFFVGQTLLGIYFCPFFHHIMFYEKSLLCLILIMIEDG